MHARIHKLAARLLARSRLKRQQGISFSQVTAALTKALAATAPESSHGRLLLAALAPTTKTAGTTGTPQPAAEVAVRLLLGRGQVPTAAAVVGQVASFDQRKAATAAREQRRKQLLSSDGPRAATLVNEHWQAHGHGPTWRELGRAMGWPSGEVALTVRALAKAGWLTVGSEARSLRPGPQVRQEPTP
jgi:hypothetical protein